MKLLLAALLLLPTAEGGAPQPRQPRLGECHTYDQVKTDLAAYGEFGTGPTLVEVTRTAVEVFISLKGSMTVVEIKADLVTCYRSFNDDAMKLNAGWGAPPLGDVPHS